MSKNNKIINPVNNIIQVYPELETVIIRSSGPLSRQLNFEVRYITSSKRDREEIEYFFRRLGFRICLKKVK